MVRHGEKPRLQGKQTAMAKERRKTDNLHDRQKNQKVSSWDFVTLGLSASAAPSGSRGSGGRRRKKKRRRKRRKKRRRKGRRERRKRRSRSEYFLFIQQTLCCFLPPFFPLFILF